jgi:hypothetical protein
MENETQMPLGKLLFGPKPKPTANPEAPLSAAISAWYREGLAKSLRPAPDGQFAHLVSSFSSSPAFAEK